MGLGDSFFVCFFLLVVLVGLGFFICLQIFLLVLSCFFFLVFHLKFHKNELYEI